MSVSPPTIGSIRLTDSATPALEAGLYRLTSALRVESRDPSGAVSSLPAPPPHTMHFEVMGPRFAIDRADIGDRYPTPDSKGAFGDRLPHVALDRRTLPWERAAADGTPWIALLVFASDEAQLSTGALSTALPAAVVTSLRTLDPFTDDPSVTVVRAKDLATFRGVLPSRSDVKLLAHVRQVNLADTALAGQDDDGLFAIVTANRLPLSRSADGTTYLACLVSLEGRDDVWTVADGQLPPPLIVLHSWTFTSTGAGGTFEYLAAELDVAPFGATAEGSPAILATDGTIPVQRIERDGTSDTARYRGPLFGLATGQALGAANNDISPAAAFELGRLLGAADGRFLRELVAWHRATDTSARAAMISADLANVIGPVQAAGTTGGARIAGAIAAKPGPTINAMTTASVKETLGTLLTKIAGRPANLWRVHPAGAKIHVAKVKAKARARAKSGGAPTSSPKSKAKVRSTRKTAPTLKAKSSKRRSARPERGR